MINIRPLQPEQWPMFKRMRLAALAGAPEAYGSSLAENLQRSDNEWESFIRRRLADPNQTIFFAYCDETPCGMAACHIHEDQPEMATLISVWVEPDFRRLGVARELCEYGRKWSLRHGCRAYQLGVTETNLPALRLYQSMGFTDTGRREPLRSNPRLNIMIMELKLAQDGSRE